MKRRTFLQSSGAAFAALVTGRVPDVSQDSTGIDYSRFTALEVTRYDLTRPWSCDGVVYATDSRILISHPGEFHGGELGRLPDLSQLVWDEFGQGTWRTWPREREHIASRDGRYLECPVCAGKGRVGDGVTTCRKCLGDHDEYHADDAKLKWRGNRLISAMCPLCTTGYEGGRQCGHCEGKGKCKNALSPVDTLTIHGRYDRAIRTLGDVEYRELGYRSSGPSNAPIVAFRFSAAGGGRGFVASVFVS